MSNTLAMILVIAILTGLLMMRAKDFQYNLAQLKKQNGGFINSYFGFCLGYTAGAILLILTIVALAIQFI